MAATQGNQGLKNQLAAQAGGQLANASQGFNAVMKNEMKKIFPTIKSIVPKHVTPERLMRMMLTITSRNPDLAKCTPESVIGAVVNCAILGVEPNLIGHAYLIPYNNNKTGFTECQFQIGYKGYLDLIRRTGEVSQIYAHVVHEQDEFDYEYGLNQVLKHKPAKGDRGKPIYYYAVYHLKDGGYGFEVMSREDIERHRDKFSKAKKFGPWIDHFDAMALKTVIKQMVKWMPISIEIQEQIGTDEATIKPHKDNGIESDDIFDIEYQVTEVTPVDQAKEPENPDEMDFTGTPFEK